MRKREKVIVSCAITGAIHTPTMTPHLPVTPQQIAESAIGANGLHAAIAQSLARLAPVSAATTSPLAGWSLASSMSVLSAPGRRGERPATR